MYEKVKKAQKKVDIIMYIYIGVSILLVITFFVKYGTAEGLYRLITLGTGTVTAIALYNSIKEGNPGARIFQGSMALISAIFGLYALYKVGSELSILGKVLMIAFLIYMLFSGAYLLFSHQVILIRKYYKKYNGLVWAYNWKGICIGYIDDEFLVNPEGKIIGKFVDNEVYSPEGKYLGEAYKSNKRLCIDKDKAVKSIEAFEVNEAYERFEARQKTSSLKLYTQFEDFNVAG